MMMMVVVVEGGDDTGGRGVSSGGDGGGGGGVSGPSQVTGKVLETFVFGCLKVCLNVTT